MNFVSNNWKTLSKKVLIKNKYVGEFLEEEVERPDGKVSTYYIKRKDPFSIIIPLQGDVIHMVRQYRYSVESLSLEFPMGFVEGKNPLDSAKQELKEEMGIEAVKIEERGHYWVAPGGSSQYAYVFIARDLSFGDTHPEDGEFLQSEKYTIKEVKKMIDDGSIKDGPTIVAFHYLENYLNK